MTGAAYKNLREQIGTQTQVAVLLGVTRGAIAKREAGANRITREAELALLSLSANIRALSRAK